MNTESYLPAMNLVLLRLVVHFYSLMEEHIVVLGNECWMAINLNETRIRMAGTTGHYDGNEALNKAKYASLYDWEATIYLPYMSGLG